MRWKRMKKRISHMRRGVAIILLLAMVIGMMLSNVSVYAEESNKTTQVLLQEISLDQITQMDSVQFGEYLNEISAEELQNFLSELSEEDYEAFQEYLETLEQDVLDQLINKIGGEEAQTLANNSNVTINITKTWENEPDTSKRPSELKIEISRSVGDSAQETVQLLTLTEADGWKTTVSNLPATDGNGNAYTYTVSEPEVPSGYDSTIDLKYVSGGSTSNPTTTTKTETAWVLTDQLLAGNEYIITTGKSETAGTISVSDGQAKLNGENVTISSKSGTYNGQNTTLTYISDADATDITTWTSEPSVSGRAYLKNGTGYLVDPGNDLTDKNSASTFGYEADKEALNAKVFWNTSLYYMNNWGQFYSSSPAINTYLFVKTEITETSTSSRTTYTDQVWDCNITNTYDDQTTLIPTDAKFDLKVVKQWDDAGHEDARPDSLTVNVYSQKDGQEKEVIDTLTLSPSNSWSGTVNNLPVLDEDGKSIEYGLKEFRIPSGYEAKYSWSPEISSLDPAKAETQVVTCTLTNKYTGVSNTDITIDIVKEWDDAGHESARPSSLAIELWKTVDGKETKLQDITLTAADDWKYSVGKLPIEENGKSIEYKVKENEVPQYYNSKITFEEDQTDPSKLTCNIKNTYDPGAGPTTITRNPGKIQITAQKLLDEKAPGSKQFTFKLKDKATGLLKGDAKTNDSNGTINFDELQYSQTGVFSLIVEEQDGSYLENGKQVTDDKISYAAAQDVEIMVTQSLDLSQFKNPIFCGNSGSDYIYLEINGEPMKVYSISKSESLPNAYYNVTAEPTSSQLANQTNLQKLMYFMDTNNGIITVNDKNILLTAETKQNIVWAATGNLSTSEQVNGVTYATILNYISENSNPPSNYKVALATTNGLSGQQVIAGYYKDRSDIDYICNVRNAVEINNYTKVDAPAADGTFSIKAQKLVDGHIPGKDNIFQFVLSGTDGATKNIHTIAKNNENGEIVFTEQNYPVGEYNMWEIVDPDRTDLEFDTEVKKVTVTYESQVLKDAIEGKPGNGDGTVSAVSAALIRVSTSQYSQEGYCMRQGYSSPSGNTYTGEIDPSESRIREIANRSSKGGTNTNRYVGSLSDTLKKVIYFASQNTNKEVWVTRTTLLKVQQNEIQQIIWYVLGQSQLIGVNARLDDGSYPGSSTVTFKNAVEYIVNNTTLPENYHLIAYTTSNTNAQPIIAALGSETVVEYATSTVPVFNNKTKTETPQTGTTEASVEINVKKYLDGEKPGNKSFKFVLKNEQGQQIGKEVTNDSDGNVKFPAITYTEPGTYTYTIEEVNDNQSGIKYDEDSVRTVTVTITEEMLAFGNLSNTFVGTTEKDSDNWMKNDRQHYMQNGDFKGNAYCINSTLEVPQGQNFTYVKNPTEYSMLYRSSPWKTVTLDQETLDHLKGALYYFETEEGQKLCTAVKNEIIWAVVGEAGTGVKLTTLANGMIDVDAGAGTIADKIQDTVYYKHAYAQTAPDGYDLVILSSGTATDQPMAMLVPKPEVKTATVSDVLEFYNETEDVTPEPSSPEVEVEAQKTVDGERPGENMIFHFKLWDADPRLGNANLISEADNTADGKIVFPDKINETGTYWIEEVVDKDKYPNIEFDSNRYQKIQVVSEAKTEIISDGKTTYKVGTNSSADQYEDLRIVVNEGEANEKELQAYCINENITTPVNEDYHIFINPTDAELALHTKGNAYVVKDLKKLLYFFDNPDNTSITFTAKNSGQTATAYLDATRKQWLLWILTGNQEKGASATQQYMQPAESQRDRVSRGIQPYATYQEVLDAILAQAPEAPDNYQLLLAIPGSNINSSDSKQPIVAGFEPKGGLRITYESSATTVTFNNKVKKTGEFLLQKIDGTTQKALSGEFKFTLKDTSGASVSGYENVSVDSKGQILFENLPYGEYYLDEVSCPDAYVLLKESILVKIDQSGVSIASNSNVETRPYSLSEKDGNYTLTVKNYQLISTPESGSTAQLSVWLAGFCLLLAGLLLMIKNKKYFN